MLARCGNGHGLGGDISLADRAILNKVIMTAELAGRFNNIFLLALIGGMPQLGHVHLLGADLGLTNRAINNAQVIARVGAGSLNYILLDGSLRGMIRNGKRGRIARDLSSADGALGDRNDRALLGAGRGGMNDLGLTRLMIASCALLGCTRDTLAAILAVNYRIICSRSLAVAVLLILDDGIVGGMLIAERNDDDLA